MDHAIAQLKSYMRATLEMYDDYISKEVVKGEMEAYLKAINELETYYYGEIKTRLEDII